LGLRGKKLEEAEENCVVMRIQILYASPITITIIDTKVRLVMHVARMEAKKDVMQDKKLEGKGPVG
jgi:hypothetical protein